jgi:hypothetical protein
MVLKTGNFFYDDITKRLQVENKNWNCCIVGDVGSGKSWAALKLCYDFSKIQGVPFTIDNVCFSTKEFLGFVEKRMDGKIPRGSFCLFDEFAISGDADLFRGDEGITALKHTLETYRTFGLGLIATWPCSLSFAQKKLRGLFHHAILMDKINYNLRQSRGRIHRLSPHAYKDKLYTIAPRDFDENGQEVTMSSFTFHAPPKSLIEQYEKKQLAFKKRLIRQKKEQESFREKKQKIKETPLMNYYNLVKKNPDLYLGTNGNFSHSILLTRLELPLNKARALAATLNADRLKGRI